MDSHLCFGSATPISPCHSLRYPTLAAGSPRSPRCAFDEPRPTRRAALLLFASAALPLALPRGSHGAPAAAPPDAEVDDVVGYSFRPPAGWQRQVGSISGGRRVTAFLAGGDNEEAAGGGANVSVVATPVAADYQKLTSFGGLGRVVQTLVPPKSGGEVVGTRVDPEKNAYIVEYKMKGGDGVQKRLLTVFSLVPGRFIVSLTAQSGERQWNQFESTFRQVVDSYRLLDEK